MSEKMAKSKGASDSKSTSTKKQKQPAKPATASKPKVSPKPAMKPKATPRPQAVSGARKPSVISGMAAGLGEEVRARLEAVQDRLGDMQESLLLTDVHNSMEEIETTLSLLPVEVEKLRTRGYVFRSFLGNKIEVLAGQWAETRDRAAGEVSRRQRDLERESDEAESALRQAASGGASQVSRAESAVEALERKVSAARSAVMAMYESLGQNVSQARAQVEEIGWTLDQVDEASFRLRPAEDVVMACRAQHMEDKKDGPEGVLYLTDARLVFERKEEVATKKVLFITTEKEKVQEVIFDVPVGQIEEAKASQKGLLGHKEMLELLFAPEADLNGATLRLHADNEEWAGLIGRVQSGDISKERTKPKDEAAVEAVRSAPTKCPTCGATLSVEIVRGMQEINCEYCGSVIRL